MTAKPKLLIIIMLIYEAKTRVLIREIGKGRGAIQARNHSNRNVVILPFRNPFSSAISKAK